RFFLSPALHSATSPDWPPRHHQQAYLNRLRPLLPIPAPASIGSRPRCLSKFDSENPRTSADFKCLLSIVLVDWRYVVLRATKYSSSLVSWIHHSIATAYYRYHKERWWLNFPT
ncbi:hypothetical protein AVEN_264613-2-1, partial [Araneus ventricosus]